MNEASGCGLYRGPSQHQRLHKTVYGNAVWHPLHPHRTDERNSTTQDNAVNSNSPKAQGKGVMHPVLTEVSLQLLGLTRVDTHGPFACIVSRASWHCAAVL